MNPASLMLLVALAGYVRSHVVTGDLNSHCLWWPAGNIPITQSSFNPPPVNGETTFSAVRGSYGSWQTVSDACGNFTLQETQTSSGDQIGYDPSANDNQNLVVFRDSLCTNVAPAGASCFQTGDCANVYHCWQYGSATIGLTTTTFSKDTGQIFDADIEFNAASFQFTTSDVVVKTDVRNTATHEMGHFLGLDHSPDPDSTMFARAPDGETSKRSLDAASKQFICDAYPKGQASKDCIAVTTDTNAAESKGCSSIPGGPGVLTGLLWLFVVRKGARKSSRSRIPLD